MLFSGKLCRGKSFILNLLFFPIYLINIKVLYSYYPDALFEVKNMHLTGGITIFFHCQVRKTDLKYLVKREIISEEGCVNHVHVTPQQNARRLSMKAMKELQETLQKKRRELEELVKSRSKANCIDVNSSPGSVTHQLKIEELEDEIAELEKKLSA